MDAESELNCASEVEGPETMLHAPVPFTGAFAARTALPLVQMACGAPALAVVGGVTTTTVTAGAVADVPH